jgi:hypothetical protein
MVTRGGERQRGSHQKGITKWDSKQGLIVAPEDFTNALGERSSEVANYQACRFLPLRHFRT